MSDELQSRATWLSNARIRYLPLIHFFADSAVWAIALPLAMWLRYDFSTDRFTWFLLIAVAAAIVLQGQFGLFFGQYRRRWMYGSFDEIRGVAATALLAGAVLTLLLWGEQSVPRSVPALATGLSLLGHVTVRSVWRLYQQGRGRTDAADLQRLLVVGAGSGGAQIIKTLHQSESKFRVVGILDDDPNKQNLELTGCRVLGPVSVMAKAVERVRPEALLIAVPTADGAFIRGVTEAAEALGLEVFVLPGVDEFFGGPQASDIRPVRHEDLLGRRPADIDTSLIAHYITGRRVLVTGAGGSIGSEICRQLVRFDPAELLMLDRDETGLHGTQLSLTGRALLEDKASILGDIRDAERMDEVFAEYQPEVVFHTAALKHLPLLEMYPDEGWKTNVCGTLNLLRSASKHGAETFVNVSTDKAADPTSVLGWTKRIAERLAAHANQGSATTFVSVRFGNVLGSNGSVLKSFEAQTAQGGPITVTHPDITRYFMTIEEASRLTIHAGAIGEPGEVMILDMGEPVKILDVARRFAEQHDPPIEIVFTGLRKNEKMHEDLVADAEAGESKQHPLITHVGVPPLDPNQLQLGGAGPTVASMIEIALLTTGASTAP